MVPRGNCKALSSALLRNDPMESQCTCPHKELPWKAECNQTHNYAAMGSLIRKFKCAGNIHIIEC